MAFLRTGLSDPKVPPRVNGSLEVSSVNIEENSRRTPIPYVTPPGVSRQTDPSQPQLRRENEQALSLKVTELAPRDARAVYKTTSYDLRQYKRLQLFAHAEALPDSADKYTPLADGDLSVFIRLGSDYKNNYYEYEVPQKVTQPNQAAYTAEDVWNPTYNTLDFPLELLTNLKLNRNKKKRAGEQGITFNTVYSETGEGYKVSIIGNPSLSEVKTIMIGVRNYGSNDVRSGEIWVNELRLSEFNEEGGWAANANLNVAVSDLATVNVGGRIETAGFGALDQSLAGTPHRRLYTV